MLPLLVQFTDLSENATGWNWDFGDGANSTEQNPMHIYTAVGAYTVNLTVINENGTDSKLAKINVLQATPEIKWSAPADIIYGTALNSTQLNASASIPGTFAYTPGNGTVLSVGSHTLHVDFTPEDTANYSNASKNVTINVLNARYSIFKAVIGVDENGDCILDAPRDVLQYRVVVKNEGNVSLNNVKVTDSLINLTGPIGNDTKEGVLNPGEIWIYTGNYSVTKDDINNGTGYINNTATVSCNELPPKSSNINQPIAKKADLSIYKSVTGIDEAGDHIINKPGDLINYQVAVKNNGDVKLTEVSVSDPMVTLIGPKEDHTDSEVLNPGEIWVYTGDYEVTEEDIEGNVNESGFIDNTATVSCNELQKETSSIMLPIIQTPLFVVTSDDNYKVLPVANFNANPTSGYAPLSIQFTDLSQNAESTSWDFNSDGVADSNDVSPAYTYTTPGTYTVNLTVSNANGTNSKTATINVLKTSSSSSGGSSRSKGGSTVP